MPPPPLCGLSTDTGTSTWTGSRGTSNTGVAQGAHPGHYYRGCVRCQNAPSLRSVRFDTSRPHEISGKKSAVFSKKTPGQLANWPRNFPQTSKPTWPMTWPNPPLKPSQLAKKKPTPAWPTGQPAEEFSPNPKPRLANWPTPAAKTKPTGQPPKTHLANPPLKQSQTNRGIFPTRRESFPRNFPEEFSRGSFPRKFPDEFSRKTDLF